MFEFINPELLFAVLIALMGYGEFRFVERGEKTFVGAIFGLMCFLIACFVISIPVILLVLVKSTFG